MQFLSSPTEDFIKTEKGILNADAAAGSNASITLKSNQGFAENDFVAIGHEGSELAELQQINAAVSGDTNVQVATLKFAHKAGEPVRLFRFNQRKFYGSLTAGGSYTELTADGSPKDIQVDDPQGTWLEYTQGEGFLFFKATYYNSQTEVETALADALEVEADESKRYTSIYAVRKHAGLLGNRYYSDGRVEVKRQQAENEINSVLSARYQLPLAEVPALLGQICELLAAGYIDFEEFGKDGEGVKWLGEGRALLKALAKGSQRLIGADGTELARHAKVGVLSGFPDGSIAEGASDARKFDIGQQF